MKAWDEKKNAIREFAMKDMANVKPTPTFMPLTLDKITQAVTRMKEIKQLPKQYSADNLATALAEAVRLADECADILIKEE